MKKIFSKSIVIVLLLSMLFSMNVFAAGLTQDETGIHYILEDGTMIKSMWVEIADIWFFFDANGVCTTPTGVIEDPTDSYYQLITSYMPCSITDKTILAEGIKDGAIVLQNGEYYFTPEAATYIWNSVFAPQNREEAATNTLESEAPNQNTLICSEVWVSSTGNKYHNKNNCGKMNPKNARKISLDDAKAQGLTACSKCF